MFTRAEKSVVVDQQAPGSIFQVGKEFSIYFLYTIFLQQPGLIKITNSKSDLVMYSQFCCENKMEC
jgi:hypothetical protein